MRNIQLINVDDYWCSYDLVNESIVLSFSKNNRKIGAMHKIEQAFNSFNKAIIFLDDYNNAAVFTKKLLKSFINSQNSFSENIKEMADE